MTVPNGGTAGTRISAFSSFPGAIRKAVYTAGGVETGNYTVQRIIKDRRCFPNERRRWN
jgi:transposase-like protein